MFMRHKLLVLTVKMVKIGPVYICGSYRKINTGVPLFWTTLYVLQLWVSTHVCVKCSRDGPILQVTRVTRRPDL